MKKSFIFSTLAIIIILGIAFFSQQPSALKMIKDFSASISKYAGASLSGGLNLNPFKGASNTPTANTPATGNNTNTSAGSTNTAKLADGAYSAIKVGATAKIDLPVKTEEKLTVPSAPEKATISEKVTETIKSGGEAIKNTIGNANENISSAEKNISNYFSEVTTSIIKPGTPQNCPAVTPPSK